MEDVVDNSYDSLEEIRVDLDKYSEKYKFTEGNFDLNVTINDIARIGNLPDNNIPNSAMIYSICDKELRFMEVMYTYFEVLKNTSEDMQLVDEMTKKLSHVTGLVRKFSSSLWHLRQLTDPDFAGARTVDEHLWTNKMLEDYKMTDLGKLRIFILRETFKRNLKRCGGDVMEQVLTEDGLSTRAWKKRCDIREYVQILCPKHTELEKWCLLDNKGLDSIVTFLKNCREIEFPELKVQNRVWSFNDGFYVADEDRFYPFTSSSYKDVVSCKRLDANFSDIYSEGDVYLASTPKLKYDEIETPHFDSIFKTQDWDREMIRWMYVFMGRLFYKLNTRDCWQVIPFLKGVAGTGKSTVIKVLQEFYAANDVGIISNNIEATFGLSSMWGKMFFAMPEVKNDLRLSQADFQSMVTGEQISTPVKHDNPIVQEWDIPGILAGNESPGWEDKSGSISRRVVVFDFPKVVPASEINTELFKEIKSELPGILRKCVLAYNAQVDAGLPGSIWNHLPPKVCKERENLQFKTNPLYGYLCSPDVKFGEDMYVLEAEFINRLKNYASTRFSGVHITYNEEFYKYVFDMDKFLLKVEVSEKMWPPNSGVIINSKFILGISID